jgi:hypothetical protein
MLLFKLDIKKAFDSVRWDYLMDMLEHLGFPPTFRDWVSALLASASSRFLFNGLVGDPIKHRRDLRQGDPSHRFFLCSPSAHYTTSFAKPLNKVIFIF